MYYKSRILWSVGFWGQNLSTLCGTVKYCNMMCMIYLRLDFSTCSRPLFLFFNFPFLLIESHYITANVVYFIRYSSDVSSCKKVANKIFRFRAIIPPIFPVGIVKSGTSQCIMGSVNTVNTSYTLIKAWDRTRCAIILFEMILSHNKT